MASIRTQLRLSLVTGVSAAAMLATPAFAQDAADSGIEEIIVTAQRQAESLQDVPIAISAFSAEALEKQQIDNASDLQLTLPNVTFTKGNFTGSSFTIRGIGDLCVGVACDSATAIHLNDMPLIGTRLFETEYFDLERVEVLRGPQGTLFGRNATSGVVNFITAKPDMRGIQAKAEAEYGNYDSIKLKGMLNLPVNDTLGVRVAGFYLNRGGYTTNLFNNTDIDDRNMYAIRGSIRWEPTENTRIDLLAYYFREDDSRMRIQKQQCQRDPTGVLGCLPARRDFSTTNGNASFVGVLSSREFLTIQGGAALGAALGSLGLGSLYGTDPYAAVVNPTDVRTVNTDFTPEYFTDEQQYQARIEHDFGSIKASLSGQYQSNRVDSRQDYNLSVQNAAIYVPGLTALQTLSSNAASPLALLAPIRTALFPSGPNGPYCTSDTETTGTGAYGGHSICGTTPLDFDRSVAYSNTWTGEAIIESAFDGPFNFLLGGIYNKSTLSENSYYVNAFGIDYVAGVLGVATTLGQRAAGNATFPNSYLGTPFFRNNTDTFSLKSYGLFGEAYFDLSERVKITGGLRYNSDKKAIAARSTLASFPVPFGSTTAFSSPFAATFDADPGIAGAQPFQVRNVSFSEWTGRIVLDFKVTEDNLVYASYSRGYKSGGINPPLQPIFAVPDSFSPEFINSFEIGTKNTMLDGTLRLNLTGFYYQYKNLQLSRIVARTLVNDNVNADIYGLEAEAIVRPSPNWLFNIGASYLNTKVSQDKFLSNPRDPSGGRGDAVIIKDITNGSNCTVVPTVAGNATGTNTLVGAINGGLGLRAPASFGADSGLTSTGAFSICSVLANAIANPSAPLRALFATPTGALAFTVENAGVATNIKGNKLPQAPNYKFSVGAQYTAELSNGMTLVPRWDYAYTGESYGNIFNGNINKVNGYGVMNAQLQLNGVDDRWFARAFVQNITDNNATTGLYVTDQSSGLYTNIFTLEPRRYGIAAGVKF